MDSVASFQVVLFLILTTKVPADERVMGAKLVGLFLAIWLSKYSLGESTFNTFDILFVIVAIGLMLRDEIRALKD